MVDRPYANGQWTLARFRSFIMSALRGAKWPPKYQALRDAYAKTEVNPSTGRMCKLHECSQCGNLFPQKDMAVDHIEPVIPIDGFDCEGFLGYNWDQVLRRLFVETEGLQALCKPCHKLKTIDERNQRNANRKRKI